MIAHIADILTPYLGPVAAEERARNILQLRVMGWGPEPYADVWDVIAGARKATAAGGVEISDLDVTAATLDVMAAL